MREQPFASCGLCGVAYQGKDAIGKLHRHYLKVHAKKKKAPARRGRRRAA